MATTARQQYFADESSLSKEKREFSIADGIQEKIDSVEEGAQVNKIEAIRVNGTTLAPDTYKAVDIDVPEVIDNLYTVDSDNALSAKQGKLLYDYIQNIASRGRFLSNWNSVTGLPMTNPSESPYPYKSGDYFNVSNVAGLGGTNYRPDGSSYVIGQASTVVETDEVNVSDFYFYDGTNWLLLSNSGRQIAIDTSLSTTSTNPVENRVITNAINGKQNTLIAGTNIQIAADGKTISATDTTYSAGANISIDANNEISATDTTYTAGANVQISNQNVISATDTKYTAGTGINIDANNVISNTQTSAEWGNITGTLSDQTDLQNALDAKQDDMVILSYGNSTWNDFITAYQKNGVVYCRASSQSNPATGTQGRLAFMAYVNNASNPTEVEFQYYRSRSNHDSAANQLDEVYVYKLVPANGGTWTVTQRDTGAKATAGSGINLTYGSGNMTIANTGVTSINSQTGDVTLTIPTVPTNVSDFVNDAGYITANDLPTVDTSMSDSSTNAVQNNVIKNYVDTQVQEATSGAVSDTAYGNSWNGITGIAPSKNAVYDKINSMDIAIGTNTSAISTINGKIPSAATSSNQLADKNYVDDSINSVTAYYITKNAQGDQWATRAELFAATTFYSGGVVRVPTMNDYTIVLSDETHDNATTRYIYNNGWEYQYTVNETAMTQAQLNAINSGITAAKVTQYDGYATSKQDVLTAGTGIDITSNTISTLNNFGTSSTAAATVQKEVSIPGIKTLNVGQIVHILPSATSTVANSTLKVNSFTAYPMRYNNAAITTSTDSIVRPANIVTSFVFDGTYWQFLGHGLDSNTTYSNMSATEANTGTATSARTISASVLKGAVETHAPVKSVNGQTGAVTVNDVKSSTTAPSSPTEGMVWYDTTNDQLKVYDGTNWNVTGKEYNAGEGIEIGTIQDYSAMRGPAPEGYHVPSKDEWVALCGILTSTFGMAENDTTAITYMKLPRAGFRNYSSSDAGYQDVNGYYWSSTFSGTNRAYFLSFGSVSLNPQGSLYCSYGYSVRCFKDKSVTPDSSWTVLYDGSSVATGAGVYHNSSLGLISISGDGQTWYTIQDKNLGATTVYNSGDTLSETNCGKYFQRGNNYGFAWTGTITTSEIQVNAQNYGPGNYYSGSTFITKSSNWSSVQNDNLRGGATGVVTIENAITNTGVLSVNGQTGDVDIAATVMTEEQYGQVVSPITGKIYFIKES